MIMLKGKRLLLLTPVFLLFAAGVLMRSTNHVSTDIACGTTNFTGLPETATLGIFEGQKISVPALADTKLSNNKVLGVAKPSDKWIEVDLSEQKLRAWDGDKLFLETLISSGLPYFPTPTGEFHIWIKMRATKMEGGEGSYYYNLPNVPYVMFFENDQVPAWEGYGLHGTYWHNDFGRVHSHGCVNLPTPTAEQLYYWTTPTMPDGKSVAYATADNPGTRIVIHE